MVLNGYTILTLFFCLLRLLLSLVVLGVGVSSWRLRRRAMPPDQADAVENRGYLLFLSATVLLGINVASWPLLYALLQSYVREWPSVMCIYGVTQIGSGTLGASRFLPTLLTCLQWTKPLLVFGSGAAYVLYLVNRRTQTAPLQDRVLLLLLLVGACTMADSMIEVAYLVIPKTEIRLAGGCCTDSLDLVEQATRFAPRIRLTQAQRPLLIVAYYCWNMAMIIGLFAHLVFSPLQAACRWRWSLLAGALFSIPLGLLYLVEIAAPTILGLPFHHCPYDLISAAPESVLAVALFLLGCFSVGWAFVAGQFGSCEQTQAYLPSYIARLLFVALFGYVGSILMLWIEFRLV